jgi:hypothetical protein
MAHIFVSHHIYKLLMVTGDNAGQSVSNFSMTIVSSTHPSGPGCRLMGAL